MIRRFYFENERSERYDLNRIGETGLANIVRGLGMSNEGEYVRIGNHFARDFLRNAQDTIPITITYTGGQPYETYQKLVRFILTAQRLRIVYRLPLAKNPEYYRDVDIASIDKESIWLNSMETPIVLNCTSLWYSTQDEVYEVREMEGEAVYDLIYDYVFNEQSSLGFYATNNGHTDAVLQIEIAGPTEQPTMEIETSAGMKFTITFPVDIAEGELLEYSGADGSLYIHVRRLDGSLERLYPLMLETSPDIFIAIPPGQFIGRLSSATGVLGPAKVRILAFYRTV